MHREGSIHDMTLMHALTTTKERGLIIPLPQVEPRTTIPLQNLRIPGPTPVPPAVLAELARPIINHRGPEFAAILRRVTGRLPYTLQTAASGFSLSAFRAGGQERGGVN